MKTLENKSSLHAKEVFVFGHTSSGMGEKALAVKFKKGIEQAGFCTSAICDIVELLGEDFEKYAQINYDLADAGFSLIDDLCLPPQIDSPDLVVILSWCFGVAALFATGIQKKHPTAVSLFAHHPNERMLPKLYEPADLLIAESLLASERAAAYGMDMGKILYLPHTYPSVQMPQTRSYVEKLAKTQGKSIGASTKIIGCVGRLEYGKNYEFALEAVRKLREEKQDIVLVLKGDFPAFSPYPDFKPQFLQMLEAYQQEPWFLWDRKHTPYPDVLQEYASFDVLLHPSGAEGASHVVIECLGLGMPVVLLECSTNPYLFKDLATFVPTTGDMRPGPLPFHVPDMEKLCTILAKDLSPPDASKVNERFHEEVLSARIPLLFERDPEKIKKLYAHDRKCYGL